MEEPQSIPDCPEANPSLCGKLRISPSRMNYNTYLPYMEIVTRCVGLLLVSLAAFGQGPDVDARVPDFRLPDQNGVERTLKTITGPKGAVLVFYRSADW